MTNFVEITNHDPEHGKNITMKRIIEVAVNACKTTHNDAELGAKLRVLFSDVETMAEFLELNSQSNPQSNPKPIKKIVRKKTGLLFSIDTKPKKRKPKPGPLPTEVRDKW